LLACEPVLAEAIYLLQEHAGVPGDKVLALFERKVIVAPFRLEDHAGPVAHLLEKYQDQGMQLADARLVRMSELHRDCRVFTLDRRDFQVYRRFERQVIPLVAPDG
jgi:predicted nucleic acid-binding protein